MRKITLLRYGIYFAILLPFLSSCENDIEEISNNDILNVEDKMFFDKKNNTIVFESSSNLKKVYDNLKSKKDVGKNIFNNFYDKGFVPLRPIDDIDETKLERIVNQKKLKRASYKAKGVKINNDFLGSDLISNDNFASLLNDKGELQVGDTLYRYTKEGLYMVHINKRELLNQNNKSFKHKGSYNKSTDVNLYVPNKNELTNFSVSRVAPCIYDLKTANNQLSYRYKEPYFEDGCRGGGSGGGGSVNNYDNPNTSNYNYCENTKDGWIDNIFGKTYVCTYYFNSQHKLRTVFASEDFYFFTDVYAQAKFKEKSWLGWWFSDRDANTVYLLNKKVILKTERKKEDLIFLLT